MNKKALVLAMCFVAALALGVSSASADELLPGSYAQQDQSVMAVGQTMVQMGAHARTLTDAVNRASRAHLSRSSISTINTDQQFGSSQHSSSWKAARTVEEAEVRGLVDGDCQGDNSDGVYRKQMNQNRKGYMSENLVSNAMCGDYHPTLK